MTGKSEGDLIEARMNRLRLEGTPRIKRERRQHAPPISPLAADTDFSDFLIPMGENGQDFDFGTAAMRMLEGIRRNSDDDAAASNGLPAAPQPEDKYDVEPSSPSPGVEKILGQDMVFTQTPGRDSARVRRRSGFGSDGQTVNRDGDQERIEYIGEEAADDRTL